MNQRDAGILCTLAAGTKSLLDPEIKQQYQEAGDIHLLSVFRCLFSMLGISNRRKNGLKWAFASIEFRRNTYFNCVFMSWSAPESDLQTDGVRDNKTF